MSLTMASLILEHRLWFHRRIHLPLWRHMANLIVNFDVVKEPTSKRFKKPDEPPWHEKGLIVQLDPDDQYGHSMLGRLAFVSGDLDAADKHYRTADSIEPYNSKLHLLWGQVLRKANRNSEAVEHFQMSVQIDPRQIEAHRGLCELYLADGKFREAAPHAKRLCELTRYESLGDLMMLAEIHVGLGESEAAASVAHHAMSNARRVNAAAADEIAKWLRERGL